MTNGEESVADRGGDNAAAVVTRLQAEERLQIVEEGAEAAPETAGESHPALRELTSLSATRRL